MNQIKRFRKENDLSINELARRAELTPSYISNLERGKRDNPSKETMERIAEALDKTVPEVFYPKIIE